MARVITITENMADVYVKVNGVLYGGSWNTYTGGALTAADAKSRAGGQGKERSLGGPASRSDATMTIEHSEVVAGWHPTLESYTGRQDIEVEVTIQYKNPDGSVMVGASFTRTGTVKEAALPDVNSDSGAQGMYTLVASLDELPA